MEHLKRARETLRRASEDASGEVYTQLDSVQEGVFEEEEGRSTQDQPGPKVDRIAELVEKVERPEDEVENAGVHRERRPPPPRVHEGPPARRVRRPANR